MTFDIKKLTSVLVEELKTKGGGEFHITSGKDPEICHSGNMELGMGIGSTLNKMQTGLVYDLYAIHGILIDLDTRSSMYRHDLSKVAERATGLHHALRDILDTYQDPTPTQKEATLERSKECTGTLDQDYINGLSDEHSVSLIVEYTAIATLYRDVLHKVEHLAMDLISFAKEEEARKKIKEMRDKHVVDNLAKKNSKDLD